QAGADGGRTRYAGGGSGTASGAPGAAPAVDENSRQRSRRLAASGTIARAKASGRAIVARGYGARTSESPPGAVSDQPVRGIRSAKGRAAIPRARLAGAAGHDAVAHASDRQRIAPADGEGVDHRMRAGWSACPRPRPAQRGGVGLDPVMTWRLSGHVSFAEGGP